MVKKMFSFITMQLGLNPVVNRFKRFLSDERNIVENFEDLLKTLEKLDTDGKFALQIKHARGVFLDTETGRIFLQKIFHRMHKNCRIGLFLNYLLKGSIVHTKGYWDYYKKYNCEPPYTILISPTMRCNLKCEGCYAALYSKKDDLNYKYVDKIINEGKKLGVFFYTILGGEPFLWDGLFKMFKKHKNAYFQVFTNGTILTEKIAKSLQKLGNVIIHFSLEGFGETTSKRRQKNVFEKILYGMNILKEYRVPFGYSCCVDKENIEEATSNEFVDFMIDKGCLVGWYFIYIPVGRDSSPDKMPTPQQRLKMKNQINYLRSTRPIFLIDFWNDAPHVGGCICAGRKYVHINSNGDVEPCIFMHLSVDNIKEKPLTEALNSGFFKALRSRQPYNQNLYLPCPIIDNPHVIYEIYHEWNPKATHPGAELIATEYQEKLREYARTINELYTLIWEEDKKRFLEGATMPCQVTLH